MTYGPRYWGPFALKGCGPERGFRYLTPLLERPAEAHGGRPRAHRRCPPRRASGTRPAGRPARPRSLFPSAIGRRYRRKGR